MGEAPSIYLAKAFKKEGCKIKGYDPQAMENAKKILKDDIEYATNPYEAAKNADCLLLLTEWQELRYPDYKKLAELMNHKVIWDGRNVLDEFEAKDNGFKYYCIGRKTE